MEPLIITAKPISQTEYWRRLIRYRSLIWIFAWQELKVAYAQTYFGLLWAVLRPVIILSIFTVLFGYLLHIETSSPYLLFAFSGMIAWNFFSQIVTTASVAITDRQDLIRRMYFPRLILPLSKVLMAGVETVISLLLLFIFMVVLRYHVSWHLLLLPFFIGVNVCLGLAVSLWLTLASVRYRDLHQVVMPLISIGIWVTPVFFPRTIIPDAYQFLLYFNPMAAVIAGYRYALLGEPVDGWYWLSYGVVAVLLAIAILLLARAEDDIVDYA